MTQPILLALLLTGVGILGWILPYRFNILRLKRFAQFLVPEVHRPKVPKIIGTLLILGGLFFAVLGLTVLRPDPRGIPVHFTNSYPGTLEWVALEFPADHEVARQGPIPNGGKATLFVKPDKTGYVTAVFKRSNFDKTEGGNIPILLGPGSLGNMTLLITPGAGIEITDGIVGK